MSTPEQVRTDFYAYLDQTFGPGLRELIMPPPDVKIGERVLYQLVDNEEAQRTDGEQANREFEASFAQLAAELSEEIDGLHYTTEPVISSGLPYPRAVDIPGASDLALGSLAAAYAQSPNELPETDFALRWLFGLIFAYSAKYLIYLDFTHPQLRALYVAEYDAEFSLVHSQEIGDQLRAFTVRQAQMKDMTDGRQDVLWAKLVQIDREVQTAIKTHDKLVTSQG